MTTVHDDNELLQPPSSDRTFQTLDRVNATYQHIPTYDLEKGDLKTYQQQYGDIYFLRLAKLKPVVEAVAAEAWDGYQIGGDTVHRVERVLDVRQGELCWVAGTVYLDMPLKPNILDDISKDHWIAAPPPRKKYLSENDQDVIMLEDESGRLQLTGSSLEFEMLVTGCIVAVMGTENSNGHFEVIDVKLPDLAPQPERWWLQRGNQHAQEAANAQRSGGTSGKVAIISGLEISGDSGNALNLELFLEWLLGEAGDESMQANAAQITRLIIAGDSLKDPKRAAADSDSDDSDGERPVSRDQAEPVVKKRYGYDSTAYNAAPTTRLDTFLATLLPSIPITLLPGAMDPANVSLPQQPLHVALFPHSRAYAAPPATPQQQADAKTAAPQRTGWFHPTTNPATFSISGLSFLGTAGQPIDDIFKYVRGDDRLELIEQTLRWRIVAPTCPDTLWCYPYQTNEPFVLESSPHVYFVGNQPHFRTSIVEGPSGEQIRVIAVPKFRRRGEVVILDLDTLDVELVSFDVFQGKS